jgi:hypothetical protein
LLPEATQKTTSPSIGLKTGSTARATPALAMRAMIPHARLSSEAAALAQDRRDTVSG